MKDIRTKDKVINAASFLFYQKGFHGTSVRDIAEEAEVNVSLISYYFKSKQGLLEYAVTDYYDIYLHELEDIVEANADCSKQEQLEAVIRKILEYKLEHDRLSAFIHRELSLDSTFVREMAVTYLAKETHVLSNLFFSVLGKNDQRRRDILYMQLRGMLLSPFLIKHEQSSLWLDTTSRQHFLETYCQSILDWIHHLTEKTC